MASPEDSKLHVAMYPYFAIGHITPFVYLANQLAERGHRISLILPTKTRARFEPLNLHPRLISFIPIQVPQVEGLPPGTETTADVPRTKAGGVLKARELSKPQVEAVLKSLRPKFLVFDFGSWIPAFARDLGIKSIYYLVVCAATFAYYHVPARKGHKQDEAMLLQHPPGFPPSPIRVQPYQIKHFLENPDFLESLVKPVMECDALACRTYHEIEGPYCEYLKEQYGKPMLLTGPTILGAPEASITSLDNDQWFKWLNSFKPSSVVYCAFGSECILQKDQFQELVLGLELTELPFLVALKPPHGSNTVDEALPDGFKERIQGRGVVHGGWVPQRQILKSPAVGCYLCHCGFGSMWEALMSNCKIVLCPEFVDQFIATDVLVGGLKVAVKVERNSDKDARFTAESICKAVKLVMDEESKLGRELMDNHAKLRDFVMDASVQSSYVDQFLKELQQLPNN